MGSIGQDAADVKTSQRSFPIGFALVLNYNASGYVNKTGICCLHKGVLWSYGIKLVPRETEQARRQGKILAGFTE